MKIILNLCWFLFLYPFLLMGQGAIVKNEQQVEVSNSELEQMIQTLIDHEEVADFMATMTFSSFRQNEILLIFDNGLISNDLELYYKGSKIGFGTREDFFMMGAFEPLTFLVVKQNGDYFDVNFELKNHEFSFLVSSRFFKSGEDWNLKELEGKRYRR